ncbi:MAG: hypothetical protein HGB11_13570, partial [Chlorobiales bacterium]|nr:hypothetical protein [Chlorobiales bacterium]
MGIHYENLNQETRKFMLKESKLGGHYESPRLTPAGKQKWQELLEEAITYHDDNWLATEVINGGYSNNSEEYIRNGKQFSRVINKPQAAEQLAEGVFNRYYIRGLCLYAKSVGITGLVIYRGKAVSKPRAESEAKIGAIVPIDLVLTELRKNDFVSIGDALGVPG